MSASISEGLRSAPVCAARCTAMSIREPARANGRNAQLPESKHLNTSAAFPIGGGAPSGSFTSLASINDELYPKCDGEARELPSGHRGEDDGGRSRQALRVCWQA